MYQFFHFETYARIESKNKKSFGSISKEFMREPGNCPHVKKPEDPRVLYGVDAFSANEISSKRADNGKDKCGRKIRKDAQTVLSGVMSFPRNLKDEDECLYEKWLNENINFLVCKYGNNLLSVIEHNDEEHPHIHFIVSVPASSLAGECHIMHVHDPIKRRDTTKGGRKAKFNAYKEACRKLQDEYYNAVSVRFGLLRIGPKKKRLSRSEYMAAKNEAILLAKNTRKNVKIQSDISIEKEVILYKESKIKECERVVNIQKASLDTRSRELELKISRFEKIENDYLHYLDVDFESKKAKDFYSKRIRELKSRINEYTRLYGDSRTRFNRLNVKHTNLLNKLSLVENENNKLLSENIKLKNMLRIYKESGSFIYKEMSLSNESYNSR
ncbi:plasmid recombination protein [Vibrio splendidus]